jgi:hypothetical protein
LGSIIRSFAKEYATPVRVCQMKERLPSAERRKAWEKIWRKRRKVERGKVMEWGTVRIFQKNIDINFIVSYTYKVKIWAVLA